MRQRSTSLHWSPQYQPVLEGCRLLGVRAVLGHTPCKELVTALIERWRPETNTFHLVPGEATITLEDVEVLTGLPTTGCPLIVSPDERPVTDICEQWLGVQPPRNAIQGRTVHLLQLIGDPRVASTYSWGSAVLAWLYKVMGRAAFFSAGRVSQIGWLNTSSFSYIGSRGTDTLPPQWSRHEYLEDDLFRDWAVEPVPTPTPPPRSHGLRDRASFVWRSPSECKALKMRQRSTSLHWSPQYQPVLEGCRLLGVRAVLGHTPCKELVTALIERWRPETNTFHLVPGEATITLEDVEVLTGLPTTGRPLIVSPDERPVTDICEQWLGVQPPRNAIQGRTVRV
ncbi:Protein MAIN-LIKE 2 [Linum perenne]